MSQSEMVKSNNLAVVVLAAGISKRLGSCKQLVNYNGETLLRVTVKKALEISNDVYVVLGYKKDVCEKELENLDVTTVFNENYKKGMGTSISCGIKVTQKFKNSMILLCDQPFMPVSHLKKLCEKIDNNHIISSLSSKGLKKTVPAIFPRAFYDYLIKLDEDFGAKYLLQNEKSIDILLKEEFSLDIDTKEDKEKLLKDSLIVQ
ncbi:nucleotidyltransferase family protein [Arcobacter sp. F155]|uniref:nucleotidyltransferase family protein n=1 Tax=Arcobacter sp. F155 TaxID=2044512 RepID=UPI0013E91B43|nr:nucleotidyltransferase family protein [Arcobacter sp. F155]